MGLSIEPLVAKGEYVAAVRTDAHVAVATPRAIAGYAITDGIVEYEIPLQNVTGLAWSPARRQLAVLARGRCTLQDVKRRESLDFGTTSALSVAAAGAFVVVASKRRLRYLGPRDTAPRELVLAAMAVDITPAGRALCALRNGQVAIVDLVAQRVLPVAGAQAGPLVACLDAAGLVVANTRGFFVTMTGRIVSVVDWDVAPTSVAAIDDGVFGVLVAGTLEVRNPSTGSLLASTPSPAHKLVRSLAIGDEIQSLAFQIAVDDVVRLDLPEAVALVDQLPELAEDPRIKTLRADYAAQLVDEGHYDRALELYGDTPAAEVVAKLRPVVDAVQTEPHGDMASVFSSRTARTHRGHPAVDAAIRYLVQARRRLAITAAATSTPRDEAEATAIDTLLFVCYIKAHSPLVGPLVRVDNHCDVETVRATLLDLGRWKELAAFLANKQRHGEALELLRDKANDAQIVDYILAHARTDLELTTRFARGPLSRDSKFAAKLFEHTPLDKRQVHDFLLEVSPDAAWSLLDAWIEQGAPRELHTRKALHLLGTPDAEAFLRSSHDYDARALLKKVDDPLLQAILYGRLHEHAKAIELYIAADNYDQGMAYCAEAFAESETEGVRAAQTFFDRLVSGPMAQLVALLNQFGHRLDFAATLGRLPPDLPCDEITPFLTKTCQRLAHAAHASQLAAGVSKVYLAEESYASVRAARVSATVTPTTTCSVCQKRVGKSVIGLTDAGVVHYGCL